MMKRLFFVLLMMVTGVAQAALVEGDGKDYVRLAVQQPVANPKKVEVIEFFSYNCSHCMALDPGLSNWAKKKPADVDFKRVQIVWGAPMEGLAKFFSTMSELNLQDKLNHAAFSAVMEKHINLGNPTELAKWLKTQPGVDVARFMSTFNSFGTNAHLARAKQMTKDYAVMATPSIVVNGKYALQAAQPDVLIQHLNEMVAMARKEIK
jgi:thiol:disulfide interchange protein DsbA